MLKLFLVEADTRYYSLHAWELKEKDGTMERGELLFAEPNRETFFGKLNALCCSRDTVEEAEPISLVDKVCDVVDKAGA